MSKTATDLIDLINKKISPLHLNELGKSQIMKLYRAYDYDLILECVDISYSSYIQLEDGKPNQESVENFINKISGILYNKTLQPIESEKQHIINIAKKKFSYFDKIKASKLLDEYIMALRKAKYSESQIIQDLKTDMKNLTNDCQNWGRWRSGINDWIDQIKGWETNDNIIDKETILPHVLFENTNPVVKRVCLQINVSYENNLFDCCAIMMRRLIEILLILSYRQKEVEAEIKEKGTHFYFNLDKIIKTIEDKNTLQLSAETIKSLSVFKTLGNYAVHKIWYNCLKTDIEPYILNFRATIEELLYIAGLRK